MAKFSQIISAIDSHTEGHNTRIVLSGMPPIRGNTMAEKFVYIKNSVAHKQIREALMLEPRGHRGMFGAVLTPPCHPEADWGIIFMGDSNFLPGCGHGTIGTATVLAEMGIAEAAEPETVIVFDTPAGLVHAHVAIKDGKAKELDYCEIVYFIGPPSHPEAVPRNSARQMTVVGPTGMVGRCPCGTGTSARMAALYAKGKLKLGETIAHESLIGRFFYGQLLREVSLGEFKAVIPRITGTAHITGIQQFVIDPDDSLKYGFLF